jgi:hypothetical protein
MNITEKHIASKKRIGSLKGRPVVEVLTTGGLHLVVTEEGGKLKTLGTGPHRAVARWVAQKREPDLLVTELSKSDFVDERAILSVAPRYEALTDRFNALLDRGE